MSLPPRPPNICPLAWDKVIAARFGLFGKTKLGQARDGRLTGGCTYIVSRATWLKCAQSGCLWCRFLATRFLKKIDSRGFRLIPWMRVRVGDPSDTRWWSWSFVISIEHGRKIFQQGVSVYTCGDDPAAKYIRRRSRIPHVGAPEVLAMAQDWMEDCALNHEVCQRASALNAGLWLPKRLLDCSDPLRVRVIETHASMHGERYVALSYVWGKKGDQLRTPPVGPHLHTDVGIAVDSLPRTIRDAVRVTRAVGIRFLWLDSLCILQNCPEDKHRELVSMSKVYRYAYLTIDAASAASVDEGFLQVRPLLDTDPEAMLPFVCPPCPKHEGALPLAQIGKIYVSNALHSYQLQTRKTSLRGWCLQETLLSTRYLIFDHDTLRFRCQTERRKVGFEHSGELGNRDGSPLDPFENADDESGLFIESLYDVILSNDCPSIVPGSREWMAVYWKWSLIVNDYSRRSLSYRSDKLTACAAIAETFPPLFGSYIAGLWRDTLYYDLLWETSQGKRSGRPHKYPYAPSWSWASSEVEVSCWMRHHFVDKDDPRAEIVEFNVVPRDGNLRFGAVNPGGYLVLRAGLLPCKWDGNIVSERGDRTAVIVSAQVTAELVSGDAHAPPTPTHSLELAPRVDVKVDYDDDGHLQDLCLLPLMCQTSRVYGLMVGRAEWSFDQSAALGNRRGVYQRVGVWVTSGWHETRTLEGIYRNASTEEIVLV